MPYTLRLTDGGYMRRHDVHNIIQYLVAAQCVQVVGFSNVGKSALLRLLAQPDVWTQELGEAGQAYLPVYIDCNRMLGMSDQGFYELVLRCLQESSPHFSSLPELVEAYETLVAPASDFQIPLSFNRGITVALQSITARLILFLDEFDEPFSQIDSRVFLTLRALKDRHGPQLVYVTATGNPLIQLRGENHCTEFCELFLPRVWHLAPLTRSDVERLARRYMEAFEADFIAADLDFTYEWSGGHPPLVEGICRLLDAALPASQADPANPADRWSLHRQVARQMRSNEDLQLECAKIWDERSPEEQAEMLGLFQADHEPNAAILADLARRHILLPVEGKYQFFSRLLAEFVQRKVLQERASATSLWLDAERGEVFLGDRPVETLTNLEYRLMLLLFQNAEKIVDKYQIVTHVWGESYIDEVDDARIEKLVSRLRQKIEPDPSTPRFLTTIRGRGYRLLPDGDER